MQHFRFECVKKSECDQPSRTSKNVNKAVLGNKYSFYQSIFAPGLQALRMVTWLMLKALVAAHCDTKEYFEGRYEEL